MHRMRAKYILLGIAVLAAVISYAAIAHAQGVYNTGGNLTGAINSTAHFINRVNQSGYLILYPNLAQAYGYLDMAKNQSNESYSYVLLAKARASAQSQLEAMNRYRRDSLYALIASAALLFALLYYMMIPRRNTHMHGKRRKDIRQMSK